MGRKGCDSANPFLDADIGSSAYIGGSAYRCEGHRTLQEPPFIVGRPVTGEYFVDREEELRRLSCLVQGVQEGASSNSALIGLRRTGKTSVLENLELRLKVNARVIPVIVNCYGIATKSRLAKVIVGGAIDGYVRKTGDKAYLKRLAKTISDAASSVAERISEAKLAEFSLSLRDKSTEEDILIEKALDFLESMAEEKDVFFVVMLDEFQDVIKWGDGTLKRIRAVVQSQKRVCYVLAGSATTVMRNLVYDRRSPFYRQLVEVPMTKLDKETAGTFLEARFAVANVKATGHVIEKVVSLSGGYPDYVQRLGLELYLSTGGGGSLTEQGVDRAYEGMVLGLDGEFENYFSTFTPLEREILVALATGKIQPSEVAREVRKPIFNISKTLTRLVNYGLIERPMKGQYKVTDPVFADWLNRRFKTVAGT